MSKPFKLNHVALYAKHWYKRGDNIWEDLKKCISADGYSGEIFSKKDVMNLIVIVFEELPRRYYHSLAEIIDGISAEGCWRRSYYYKEENREYDYKEAVVRYCLSCFCEADSQNMPLTKPDFINCLPPRDSSIPARVEEIFGSRQA
jgi:hypothetical protein